MAKQKFYVVWKGRKTGVFNSWDACLAQVSGFAGAEFKAFESLSAAQAAFRGAYGDFMGKPSSTGNWKTAVVKPLAPSLCVDAACAGVPGPVEWRGVVLETGREIFKQGPYPDGTNNIGEFLAIVHALAWLKEQKLAWPLYSDSENAILWVKLKACRTKMEKTGRNAELFDLVSRAERWLAENQYPNPVMKWDTDTWGENPADFGRK
jgi:ribonuclease HI